VLAGVGSGYWDSVDAATDAIVRTAGVTAPDPRGSSAAHAQYARYLRVYPALRDIYRPKI
jgi:sugar (pentulose or hexulose) kinase